MEIKHIKMVKVNKLRVATEIKYSKAVIKQMVVTTV